MSSFTARLHLPGQTKLPLSVEVDVDEERMVLSSGHREVAQWQLAELEVEVKPDGLHLKIDHEEVVLNADDQEGLVRVLGLYDDETRRNLPPESPTIRKPNLDSTTIGEMRHEDLKSRIAEVASMLASRSVAPSDVFAKWLRLLKEINRRHGQGSLPARSFYELNTELLDLIPEPPSSRRSAE